MRRERKNRRSLTVMSNGFRGTRAFDTWNALGVTFGLGLSTVDEPDDGLEIHFHLVAGCARAFTASFNFGTLCNRGGNGVGQLSCEPVYDVIHRTAPSRSGQTSQRTRLRQAAGTVGNVRCWADLAAG